MTSLTAYGQKHELGAWLYTRWAWSDCTVTEVPAAAVIDPGLRVSPGMGAAMGAAYARLRRLVDSLQDPEKVARFQQLCGVQRSSSSPEKDTREAAATAAAGDGPRHRDIRQHNGVLENGAARCKDAEEEGKMQPLRRNSLTGEEGQHFSIRRPLLYLLFSLGTELGNELFYISFFPFWIWNVDAHVGRRVVVVWVWVMYLGQCTKDLIRWPRPPSPPVLKLEVFYNSEYGMPSTHAMSGTAIPLSLLLLTWGRWQYPFFIGLLLAVVWCTLVCLSRVYMGMHSILDVVAGVLYAILILIVFHPALDIIDNFNLTYKYAPLIIVSLHLALGIFSFTLDTWSTSRGDTAEILGSGAGIACGSHVSYMLGFLKEQSPDTLPFTIPPFTVTLLGKAMLRVFIGLVVLLLIRAVMKMITIPMACKVFGIPCDDIKKARQRMEVELPYRYLTYGTVGFAVMFVIPCLFTWVGLH